MWKFDLTALAWTELIAEGDVQNNNQYLQTNSPEEQNGAPIARSGHSAVLYEGYICIFGGIFEVTKELNDLQLYDIANNRWICLFSDTQEPGSSTSPTKAMAAGNNSPLMRRSLKNGESSPRVNQPNKEIPKTKYQHAMQSNFLSKNDNGQQKKIKITLEENKKPQKEVVLDSPTSTDMQRSMLIAQADPSFDFMAQLKRKKNNFGFAMSNHNAFGLNMALSQKGKTKVTGIRPMPRDGHTGILHNNLMIVFGGDRHHMPFNDMFALDLPSEFDRQSF